MGAGEALTQTGNILEQIARILEYAFSIGEMGFLGFLMMTAIIGTLITTVISVATAVISFLISVLLWVLESVPVYKNARKLGYKGAVLAWIPIFGDYFRSFVLAAMVGDKPFRLFGKTIIKNRIVAFWLYIAIDLFGSAVISTIIDIALLFIPGVGTAVSLLIKILLFLPRIVVGFMEFAFFRDVLDCFDEDQKSNRIAAIVVTLLDNLATLGLARLVYLYIILRKKPVTQKVIDM